MIIPPNFLTNEKFLLQEAVDNLLDNDNSKSKNNIWFIPLKINLYLIIYTLFNEQSSFKIIRSWFNLLLKRNF